jgi:hypothetical protein
MIGDMIDQMGAGGYLGQQAAADLAKALEVGDGIVEAGDTGGTALRVQSLERTLKKMDLRKEDCLALSVLPDGKASSTALEYTREISVGDTGDGFIPERADPGVVDTLYERCVANVRFIGITGDSSLAATLVNTITDVEAAQVQAKTRLVAKLVEQAIWEGDHTVNPLSWDGFRKQIEDWVTANPNDDTYGERYGNVIDLRGEPITPELLNEGATVIGDRFGNASDLICPTIVRANLANQLYASGRWQQGRVPAEDRFGRRAEYFSADTGDTVHLHAHKILSALYAKQAPTVASGTSAPTTPAVTVTTGSNASTQLEADTYYYKVVAFGATGRSASSTVDSQAVNGSQDAVLTITNVAGATYYEIYRGTANTDLKPVGKVAASRTGTTTFTDAGATIAGTYSAFMMDLDPDQVAKLFRLADFMKIDIPMLGTYKRFMMLWYGVPVLFNPRKCVLYKNIGLYVPA